MIEATEPQSDKRLWSDICDCPAGADEQRGCVDRKGLQDSRRRWGVLHSSPSTDSLKSLISNWNKGPSKFVRMSQTEEMRLTWLSMETLSFCPAAWYLLVNQPQSSFVLAKEEAVYFLYCPAAQMLEVSNQDKEPSLHSQYESVDRTRRSKASKKSSPN